MATAVRRRPKSTGVRAKVDEPLTAGTLERGKKFFSRLLHPDDVMNEPPPVRRSKAHSPYEQDDDRHFSSRRRDYDPDSHASARSSPSPHSKETQDTKRRHHSTTKARDDERKNRTDKFHVEEYSSEDEKRLHERAYKRRSAEDESRRRAEERQREDWRYNYIDPENPTPRRLEVYEKGIDDAIRYLQKSRAEVEANTRSPPSSSSTRYGLMPSQSFDRIRESRPKPVIDSWTRKPRAPAASNSSRRQNSNYPSASGLSQAQAPVAGSNGLKEPIATYFPNYISKHVPKLRRRISREGPWSSKRDAVRLSMRVPMPPGTSSDEDDDEDDNDEQASAQSTELTIRPLPVASYVVDTKPVTLKAKALPVRGATSKPEDYGWHREHFILGPMDSDILIATNHLGHGSLGVVDEVRCKNGQFPTFVRKRVKLPVPKRKAAAYLKIAQEEASILGSLVHPHIVSLIGSYEDTKNSRNPSYCLLMAPVGENDLETFLTIVGEHAIASELSIRWRGRLRNWMACLASALEYMHASGIRHQDIKPSNIIHKGDQVFFTDFSSSSTFKVGHTTSTENPARSTPMYGAPEVTSDRGKHGRTTDIFSLGCVFSDMLSVAEGRTVHDFQDFLRYDGKPPATDTGHVRQALNYSEKVPLVSEWFTDSSLFKTCVFPMLHMDRRKRPAAAEVLQSLVLNSRGDRSCVCIREGTP